MILQDYIILFLWVLGGFAYSTASYSVALLTGRGDLIEGAMGKFALIVIYITWPLWILREIVKRR